MNIIIENEYSSEIEIDYEKIITNVVNEAIAFVKCPYECEVYVSIVDNNTIHKINYEHRSIDRPTDVLSFPMLEYKKPGDFSEIDNNSFNFNPDTGDLLLGDIIISYDKVIEQSNEYNHSLIRELGFLVAHSMLHLFGYDHIEDEERIEMEKKQNNILENLGIKSC